MSKLMFGDLLKIDEGIILHQVNELGTMKAGLGKLLNTKYTGLEIFTQKFIYTYSNCLGKFYPFEVGKLTICNCFTEKGLCSDRKPNDPPNTQYNAVIECFNNIYKAYNYEANHDMVFLPFKYGCGLAGGNWNIVQEILKDYPFIILKTILS